MRLLVVLALILALIASAARAQDARIAVAANFTAAAQDLADAFTAQTGKTVGLSFGSTGQLYTQIVQGAPFDGLLAADGERPARLVAAGIGAPQSRFTYALGRLALFSAETGRVTGPQSLAGAFSWLAIAEPNAAPYGSAAVEVLAALDLTEALAGSLVIGQNIAQTYQFVVTGNAEMGFVALAQIAGRADGSRWIVPESMHAPIAQDAVVIAGAPGAGMAEAFFAFLRREDGVAIIESHGYSVPEELRDIAH